MARPRTTRARPRFLPGTFPRARTPPGDALGVGPLPDRANLDHPNPRRREPRGDLARLVEVLGLDEEEPAELLLGLRERAVGGGHLAAPDADGPGRAGRLEGVGDDVVAPLPELLVVLQGPVDVTLHLRLRQRLVLLLVVIDHEHESHRFLLSAGTRSGVMALPSPAKGPRT